MNMTKHHHDSLLLRVSGRAPFDKVLWASDGVRRMMYHNPVGKTVSEVFGGYVYAECGESRTGQLVKIDNSHYILTFTDIGFDSCLLAALYPVSGSVAVRQEDSVSQLDEEVRKKTLALNQAVSDLELHRKKLSQTNQISGAGNFEYLSDQKCLVLTPDACRVLGVEDKNCVISIDDICGKMKENKFRQLCETIAGVTENTKLETEITFTDDHGTDRHLRVVMKKLSPTTCVLDGVFHDITFRKNAEKELRRQESFYRTLYNKANIGIFTMDAEGNILDCNEHCLTLSGYTAEELKNRKASEILILPEDRERISAVFYNLLDTIEKSGSVDFRIRTKQGSIIDVLMSFEAITGEGGEVRIFCFISDITHYKQVQQKNIEQERMLLQQSKMATMGEMVGIIAHQWVQPLNAISMIAQMLQELLEVDAESEKLVRKTVASINEQIEFMTATINDFRDFLKPSCRAGNFSILRAVNDVLQLFRPQLKYHKIKCGLYPEDETLKEVLVFGYENEFKNVVLNLLTNARDAIEANNSDDGEIDIVIGRRNERVLLSVIDNGGGISSDMVGKIFSAYASTKGEKGTGLGLYMSKLIITERMKGTIFAENTGFGAKITISLGIVQA